MAKLQTASSQSAASLSSRPQQQARKERPKRKSKRLERCVKQLQQGFKWLFVLNPGGSKARLPVMLLLLGVIVLDFICAIIRICLILNLDSNWAGVLSWLLVPPLNPLLHLLLGPVFVVWESAELGRLYAKVTLQNLLNIVAVLLASFKLQTQQRELNLADAMVSAGLKLAICFFTNMHCRNLESTDDLTYIEFDANDFISDAVQAALNGKRSARGPNIYRELSRLTLEDCTPARRTEHGRTTTSSFSSLGGRPDRQPAEDVRTSGPLWVRRSRGSDGVADAVAPF